MDAASSRHRNAAAAASAGRPVLVRSFDQWRTAARELLAHHVPPHAVQWISHKHDGDLFALAEAAPAVAAPHHAAWCIPRQLMDALQSAACCSAPNRWAFLYFVLWRWQQGDKAVLSRADADGARLQAMACVARREVRSLVATLRFRERHADAGPPRFVAWFEPAHDVLFEVAKHFASSMRQATWMIATPDASVMWDGKRLHTTGPLLRGPADIEETGDAPWLGAYRAIFKPARLHAELLGNHLAGLEQCRRCALWQHATQAVGGAGPPRARIMLVGEQPGDQEDVQGKPFVGPAGQLLDRALRAAALERRQVYLTNAVKHFKWTPRGKRRLHKTPAQREVEACHYWFERELAQVAPKVVVALGSTALKAVLGNPHAALKDMLGKQLANDGRWVVAIYHPAYALRVPDSAAREATFQVMVEGLRLAHTLAQGERP
jgi:probable DNA metabolism protein